jgi:hypothetical protein
MAAISMGINNANHKLTLLSGSRQLINAVGV